MDKKVLALAGAAVMIVGLFLPALSALGVSASLLMPGGGVAWEGLIVLACAVLGGGLALAGQTRHALWPGVAALAFLVWKYMEAKSQIGAATELGGADLPPEIASQLAERMPQLNMLGWGVMGLGAVILIVAGAMAWKDSSSSAPPPTV